MELLPSKPPIADSRKSTWPKRRDPLTPEQQAMWEDWYKYFLDHMYTSQFGPIHRFNHTYAARSAGVGGKILEIGPGTGAHLDYEPLELMDEYIGVELRPAFSDALAAKHRKAHVVVGDCQQRLPFPDGYFDRALAIHVLEHLDNLPAALKEISRVLKPAGAFSVVIPAEGGVGYSLGRKVTVQRTFEKRYGCSYQPFIRQEHVNTAEEIIGELRPLFEISHQQFFPLGIPSIHMNLVIGFTLTKPRRS